LIAIRIEALFVMKSAFSFLGVVKEGKRMRLWLPFREQSRAMLPRVALRFASLHPWLKIV